MFAKSCPKVSLSSCLSQESYDAKFDIDKCARNYYGVTLNCIITGSSEFEIVVTNFCHSIRVNPGARQDFFSLGGWGQIPMLRAPFLEGYECTASVPLQNKKAQKPILVAAHSNILLI